MHQPSEFVLVCPNSEALLRRLRGRRLVVRVSSVAEIQGAYDRASVDNSVHCILVEERQPLSAIPLRPEWKAVPVALHVPEMGDFRRVLTKLQQLREWNIRVFMPGRTSDGLRSHRILSSLLVPTGLPLVPPLDWEAANDLMHYSMYTRTAHADIEPFAYVKSTYDPQQFTYLQSPLFENPLRYLHLDTEENIALSAAALRDGPRIGRGLEALSRVRASSEYLHILHGWQAAFLENRKCSYCPAWRLCQGSFLSECDRDESVFRFFEDLLAAADAACAARASGTKWQP